MEDSKHAIGAALETLKGLLNAFTNPENRDKFRTEAIEQLQRSDLSAEENTTGGELPGYQSPDLSKVIHEGQLLKKGDWRWHKRFCVLDGLYFRIFNDKGELKPKYVIPLIRLTQVRREAQNRFIVTPFPEDGPPVVLEAEPARVSEWLLAFQRAREICFPDDPPAAAMSVTANKTRDPEKPESPHDLERRFQDLLNSMHEHRPIQGLGSLSADGTVSAAEASVSYGRGSVSKKVMVLMSSGVQKSERCAVLAFKFPEDAAELKLNLDVSDQGAQPVDAATVKTPKNGTAKEQGPGLSSEDQQFLSMDSQWDSKNNHTSHAPVESTTLEMEENVLNMKTDDALSSSTPRSGNTTEGFSKREAKAQLADLRRRRKLGEITEDEYKDAKRDLLDKLAADGPSAGSSMVLSM